jgi:DNA-binding NtrC family response regulator
VIKLPPLRDREGDVSLLVERLLAQVNIESACEPGYKDKLLSPGAKKLLMRHSWPGNVRELLNTLRRAAIWSHTTEIQSDDIKDALLPENITGPLSILNRPLGDACDLPKILQEVAQHYLQRAVADSGGNKTVAAKLVGLPSYQTFTNWLAKYKIECGN